MRQIYQHQFFNNEIKKSGEEIPISETNSSSESSPKIDPHSVNNSSTEKDETNANTGDEDSGDDPSKQEDLSPAAASMWTRKDVKEFKESVKAEGGEAILRIGQGESVTVRPSTLKSRPNLVWMY